MRSVSPDGDAGERRRSKVRLGAPAVTTATTGSTWKAERRWSGQVPVKAGNERRDVLVEPLTCISLILFPLEGEGVGVAVGLKRQNQ